MPTPPVPLRMARAALKHAQRQAPLHPAPRTFAVRRRPVRGVDVGETGPCAGAWVGGHGVWG